MSNVPCAERKLLYEKFREDLLKRQLSNNENYDRALLTLASAALGTSVVFLRGMESIVFPLAMVLSWLSFVAAIVVTLVSYITSQDGIALQLDIAERYYLKGEEEAYDEVNSSAVWTDRLPLISAGTFVLGILLLLLFFGLNISPNQKGESKLSPLDEMLLRLIEDRMIPEMNSGGALEAGASVPRMQLAPIDERGASIPKMQQVPVGQSTNQQTESGENSDDNQAGK